ncbi:MAG: crossover junction endodeoxyribonuclease RuvC [Deltaproteobacteria bacterium]|nr:crossover junction endodeoxyribonuclease RuvC [Deltaproteobacteria bacterium]
MPADILVLGIDPGSRCTGFGLIRESSGQAQLVDVGTIRPKVDMPLADRLSAIFARLQELIRTHAPEEAAMENVFLARNPSSALKLGQARGAALVACGLAGLSVSSYDATVIKKSVVGAGKADKSQVAFMVGRILGCAPAWPSDASDALAVAICHLNQRRFRRLAERSGS